MGAPLQAPGIKGPVIVGVEPLLYPNFGHIISRNTGIDKTQLIIKPMPGGRPRDPGLGLAAKVGVTYGQYSKGANFSFVDGHAEYWQWTDTRTINYLQDDPNWPSTLYVTANNPDLARIQAGVATWPQQRQ